MRPEDRTPVVPTGPPGSPDAGTIFVPSANPFVINGDTYIYYTAVRYQHNERTQTAYMTQHNYDMRDAVSCMLAKMPEDHWVSLDAGDAEGWFVAKPYGVPSRLLVNADAAGGHVEAEFITPYGEPVEGFTRADCIGVSGNGKNQEIRWRTDTDPRSLNEQHLGGLCLRFFLRNAKLYSYSLMEPDPDGEIKRYWDNWRWCEAIKHRSGNWSRNSNEPAGGLPPAADREPAAGTRFGVGPRPRAKWS